MSLLRRRLQSTDMTEPPIARFLALWAVLAALAGVLLTPPTSAQFYGNFADLPGDYCRTRRPEACCDGRYDDCSLPIRGTLCYCDQFCNRTNNPDCCPDYWELCLGFRPPPEIRGCYKEGVYIPSGQSYKFNCNECTCRGGTLDCERDHCMVDEVIIRDVNQAQSRFGWRATNHSKFWGWKADRGLVYRTGTLIPEFLSMKMYPILLRPDESRIPRHFDARTKREWQGFVSGVRDQGWCGSSWAFSTLGVTQDRLSIESAGNETVTLSPQNLLSCDRRGQRGCQGGHVDRAWQYLRKIGVVNEECYKYESGGSGDVPQCRIPRRASLASLRCSSRGVAYQRTGMYRTEPAYRISGKEVDIQWELMTNGPVQAMMKVHRDLFMYGGGIYSYTGLTDAAKAATHSVRIVGWGEDFLTGSQPVKYWLAANSWGTDWGENGYFRIRRGYNESEIESFVLAVRVPLSDYAKGGPGARRRGAGGRVRRPGARRGGRRRPNTVINYRAKY